MRGILRLLYVLLVEYFILRILQFVFKYIPNFTCLTTYVFIVMPNTSKRVLYISEYFILYYMFEYARKYLGIISELY